jgi:hypothetical protein
VIVRFRHLSLASQAKLALLLSAAGMVPMFLLLVAAELGGASLLEGDPDIAASPVAAIFILAFAALFLAVCTLIVQLLALALLRLLPWRGPLLKVAERPDLERIFE